MTRKSPKKSKAGTPEQTIRLVKRIDKAQDVLENISKLNRIVSETLHVRNGIAIDSRNFSITSIPSAAEIMGEQYQNINDH
jgi:hypothetical protein